MNNFKPQQKLEIVLSLVAGEATADELRRKIGVRSTKTIYNWLNRLKNSADVIYRERRGAPRRDAAKLPPPELGRDEGYLPPDSAQFFEEDDDGADKALLDLYCVEDEQRTRTARPKLRSESKRGRSSLARKIAANLRQNAGTESE